MRQYKKEQPYERAERFLKLNIQHFAEDNTSSDDTPSADDKVEGSNDNQKTDDVTPAAVEFTPEQQEKVNQIVVDRVKAEQKKANDAVKEAEKLAKMNAQQKQDYELEQLRQKNEGYEKQINLMNMSKEAASMLSESNITATPELLEIVTKETADETKQMVTTFLSVVDSEVQRQIADKLRGETPVAGSNPTTSGYKSLDEISKIKDSSERLALIKKYHIQ